MRVEVAPETIAELYEEEEELRKKTRATEKALAFRGAKRTAIVDRLFESLRKALREDSFPPTSPFTNAPDYALVREERLRVFLEFPGVPPDTNHLERAIRLIAVARKNWLFCWTEIGAEHVSTVRSLFSTCRVQGTNPYTDVVDLLRRMDTHSAKDMGQLTPRLWRETSPETHYGQTLIVPIRCWGTPAADRINRSAD
jgi:transposase